MTPTEVKLALVDSECIQTCRVSQHSIQYPVGTKSAVPRGILRLIFVKIGFIRGRGKQVSGALIDALECRIPFDRFPLFEVSDCIVSLQYDPLAIDIHF